jgi:uncharacterized protein
MLRKCPQCGGGNVRRSVIHAPEERAQHTLLSPYRCRDCHERFWVVSRNAYFLAIIVGVALVMGALAGSMGVREKQTRIKEQADTHAGRFDAVAKLAGKGDPAAEYELAMMYMNGSGVAKKESEARKWLERSAGHGNSAAQYELGVALLDGRGGIQDYRGAMRWITLAAEGGYGKAQFALGIMYRSGTGTPVDDVRAYTWLNLAAAQDVDGAATVRDAVRTRLSPAEVELAQSEARRLSVFGSRAPDTDTLQK